ncbi:MAG: 3-oxoacyl-[acyl-carrier-protein] reductase [Geminicoccaceae bacterium]
MAKPFDLEGKRALVTGASGGIGSAIARILHSQGATVVLSGRRKDALDALAAELDQRVAVHTADLAETGAADTLVKAVEAEGALDILVNNAGLTRDNLMMRLKDEDWDVVLATNLTAPFKLAKAALRGMMKRRWGRIINITSIVGTTGNPGQTNYAASKGGLVALSKSLAQEVASRGITVNCIAPGFIETEMTQGLEEAQKAKLLAAVPCGRLGDPADVAVACAYLASEGAAYVTGQTLHVNGGMAMI